MPNACLCDAETRTASTQWLANQGAHHQLQAGLLRRAKRVEDEQAHKGMQALQRADGQQSGAAQVGCTQAGQAGRSSAGLWGHQMFEPCHSWCLGTLPGLGAARHMQQLLACTPRSATGSTARQTMRDARTFMLAMVQQCHPPTLARTCCSVVHRLLLPHRQILFRLCLQLQEQLFAMLCNSI